MKMKTMTVNELRDFLLNTKGSTFCGVTTETIPTLVGGKSNPLNGLKKISSVNGILNFKYQNSVNNQREREGKDADFVAGPRPWGTRIGSCVIEHKGNYYLEMKLEKAQEPQYLLNGVRVDNSEVEKHIPKKNNANQDLNKGIIYNTPMLKNIRSIRINKEEFEVIS